MSRSNKNSAAHLRTLPTVLQSVKHDTRAMLAERISALFQRADDALFEMADRCSNNRDQNLYFDSMRTVRLQRASIAQKFIDNYSRSWNQILAQEESNTPTNAAELQAENHALMIDEALEISVAAAGISSKVTSMFILPITQLSKRVEEVCKRSIDAQSNPLGPQSLGRSFIQAIETIDVNIKVRIVLLQLFERFVAEQLEPVYDRANDILADHGVLPELSGRGRNAIDADTQSVAGDLGAAGTPLVPSPDAKPTAPSDPVNREQNRFEEMLSLLGSTRAGDPAAGQGISAPELLRLLGAVQEVQSKEPIDLDEPVQLINITALLAAVDSESLGIELNTNAPLDTGCADSLDLVRMLFDHILNDRNLAQPMQVQVGRLQIPIMKVSLIDTSFFSNANHPARQLLNEVASAGIGWSSGSELKRDDIYNKIESIVSRVLSNFREDLNMFSNLIAELRHFVNKEKKKRNHVEQRVKETEQGKARATQAKRAVQNLINQKACGLRLPADSGDFISDAWSKVLVHVFITKGPDSQAWADSVETLDGLLWALRPLTDEAEIVEREDFIPHLITELEAGITLANLHDAGEQMAQLIQIIDEVHQADLALLDGSANASLPELELTEQPELILVDERLTPRTTIPVPAEWVARVDDITEGCWVELGDDEDNLVRCKLATIIQPGNRFVFVNRKGMKVVERSPRELAQALADGELRLLETTHMLDRALDAVVADLRTSQGGS